MRNLILICVRLLSLVSITASAFPSMVRDTGPEDRCLRCHGNIEPRKAVAEPLTPPMVFPQFSMDWKMYEFRSDKRPPFDVIPQPNSFIRGHTYYDWNAKSMTEVYVDKCIDIFPDGRDFSCRFTSVKQKTYFMTFSKADRQKPVTCCLWQKNGFWAPRPDVLHTMVFDTDLSAGGKKVKWWWLNEPMPGPFGYGVVEPTHEPAAFWFPVISGWVQQNFTNVKLGKPDPKYFELPDSCNAGSPVCPSAD